MAFSVSLVDSRTCTFSTSSIFAAGAGAGAGAATGASALAGSAAASLFCLCLGSIIGLQANSVIVVSNRIMSRRN